jgi:transposase
MRTGPSNSLLTDEEKARLRSLAHRARVALACAEGSDNQTVANKLRCSLGMVGKWRSRFLQTRLEGLYDEPRPGAPRKSAMSRLRRSSFRL